MSLEIKELSKAFGSKLALDSISLSMEEGEILGFIGPNGAGKTTTMNILMNFIFPCSGEAYIFGKSVTEKPHEIKKQLGFMGSEDFFYPGDSSWVNLKYMANLKGLRNSKEKIFRYADILELDMQKKFAKLSKGNKRKVSLISALLKQPKMLIMDEITSGFDPLVKIRCFDLLKELNKEQNCGIFFSSHILSEVEELCQRTAFIKAGKIIRIDDVQNISEISYSIRSNSSENFAKLVEFLQGRSDIYGLELDSPSIVFRAKDKKLTHELEQAGLFSCVDDLEIKRASLEQSFRADYS